MMSNIDAASRRLPTPRPMELNQVTLPALDVAASVAFYRRMGFELIVDAPHYARFKSTVGDATFSIHAVESLDEPSRTVVYFECDALDRQVAELEARGIEFLQQPRDEPWLWREARLADPSGNVVCLYHAGSNRLDPPWRVAASPGKPEAPAHDSSRGESMARPEEPVQRQLDAYNSRDLERFLAEYADDVQVFRPPAREPVLSGKQAFGEHYARNRFSLPNLHARLVDRIVCGNKVIDHEDITGLPEGSLAALAVYEVVDGRIRTVWFL